MKVNFTVYVIQQGHHKAQHPLAKWNIAGDALFKIYTCNWRAQIFIFLKPLLIKTQNISLFLSPCILWSVYMVGGGGVCYISSHF